MGLANRCLADLEPSADANADATATERGTLRHPEIHHYQNNECAAVVTADNLIGYHCYPGSDPIPLPCLSCSHLEPYLPPSAMPQPAVSTVSHSQPAGQAPAPFDSQSHSLQALPAIDHAMRAIHAVAARFLPNPSNRRPAVSQALFALADASYHLSAIADHAHHDQADNSQAPNLARPFELRRQAISDIVHQALDPDDPSPLRYRPRDISACYAERTADGPYSYACAAENPYLMQPDEDETGLHNTPSPCIVCPFRRQVIRQLPTATLLRRPG